MLRWLLACVALCSVAFVAVAAATKKWPHEALLKMVGMGSDSGDNATTDGTKVDPGADHNKDRAFVISFESTNATKAAGNAEAVVINDARIAVTEFQEVPCERDGQLLFVARDLLIGDVKLRELVIAITQEKDPQKRAMKLAESGLVEEKLTYLGVHLSESEFKIYGQLNDGYNFQFKGEKKDWYRRWMEDMTPPPPPLRPETVVTYTLPEQMKKLQVGDRVFKGQRLALVKPDLAAADLDVKVQKLKGAEADRETSQKTLEEFEKRYEYYKLHPEGQTKEDLRAAELQVVRYKQEVIQKKRSSNRPRAS